jgi:hypothetical protein
MFVFCSSHKTKLTQARNQDILSFEREGGVAGNDESAGEPRQVGGQTFGDPIGEIILARIV